MPLATDIESLALAWISVFALAMFLISLFAYRRSGERRILLLSLAFGLFFAKGIILSVAILTTLDLFQALTIPVIFDTAIILSFYLATLRAR